MMENKTYLLQKLTAPPKNDNSDLQKVANAFAFGGGQKNGGFPEEGMKMLNQVCSFDYMGAAEYEWGAVPKAFARMYEVREELTAFGTQPLKGFMEVFVICLKKDKEEAIKRVKKIAEDKMFLRDGTNMIDWDYKYKNEGEPKWNQDVSGWVDLDNPFMFFTDGYMFVEMQRMFFKGRGEKK